ncbi:MAG TPA: hypothetical protein VFA81_07200 [Burkholderiales bacterium]|nr:hypothetical protein [Burkholderiales bacterium]
MIDIDQYPNLALLCWNRAERTISEQEALALYEANWRFVDVEGLSAHERALIDRLVREVGNAVLLV